MEISFLIYISLLAIFYITYFILRKKNVIEIATINRLKRIHFAILFFLMTLFILSLFGVYLKWIWPSRIFMWLFYFTGLFVAIFIKDQYKLDIEKYYFKFIFFFPLVLAFTWVIPMLGAFIIYNFMLLFTVDKSDIVYNDTNYKLEFSNSFLTPWGNPILYTKNSVFEIEQGEIELSDIGSFKSITIKELTDQKLLFTYKNDHGITVEKIEQLKN